MAIRGVMVWLSAAGLAIITGCGGDGGQAVTCGGKPCGGRDGGSDARGDVGSPHGDGGDASTLTCGNVQACGGDVVGNWTFVQECQSAAELATIQNNFATSVAPSWCAIQKLVGIEPEASGSLQLDAAGNYSLDLVFGGYFDITYPQMCLVSFNCDDLTMELQSEIDSYTFPIASATSVSCSGSSSCLCRANVHSAQSQAGTYAVSGSVLTFMSTSGAVFSKDFCVQGGTLHILETSTGSLGQTTVDTDLTAIQQ
jgi:hypothetical protein